MVYALVFSIIIGIIIFLRLLFIKKSIKNIKYQLEDYNNFRTAKKIDISLSSRDIEELACTINKHIEISRQAQVKQRKAEDELKKAIANISHDLRTPLTSIIGYVQMLKSKKVSVEKQDEYLDIVEKRAKVLQGLLNEFFQLSVIESPEYELELGYVNLNNVLCDVITSFYESFNAANIVPEITLPENKISVIGNVSAVRRVIENLLVNVVKHSEGGVSIELKKEDNKANICITNLVKSLNSSEVELLFNKFYTVDESRTNKNSNTGLGLSIAKSLMDKMGGEISAELIGDRLTFKCVWKIAIK
ncbi:sensor histidine kinase [Clostridium oryzae]|uniref:histidine kinase n=1 Tax=Clostridium oryzae TaxID=1450648 RepID=A0A1V4IWF8_9CLOT|nr:HAMP domain-containing sensor histidine kinase [Clostridium oryzae]OPJ64229.1 sensor histidine kinase YycG [Clostridium oryzae]